MIWSFRICLIILFSNAFFVNTSLPNPEFTSKEIMLFFTVLILSLLTVVKFAFDFRSPGVQIDRIDVLVIIYLLAIPIAQFFMFDIISRSSLLIHFAYGVIYFIVKTFYRGGRDRDFSKTFFEILLLTNLINLTLGYGQYLGYFPNKYSDSSTISGFFFNSGPYAIFTSSLVASLATCILLTKKQGRNIFFFLSIVLVILGLYLITKLYSRSAYLGVFLGIGMPMAYCFRYKIKSFSYRIIKNKVLFIFVTLGVSLLFLTLFIWLYSLKTESANGRMLIWWVSYQMFVDNLINGVGIGNFAATYLSYQANSLEESNHVFNLFGRYADETRYAFNDILHLFCETGLLGGVCFLLIIAFILAKFLKERVRQASQFEIMFILTNLSIFVTILVSGLTSYSLQNIPIAILFWVSVAILSSFQSTTYIWKSNYKLAFIICLICVGVLYGFYGFKRNSAYLSEADLLKDHWKIDSLSKIKRLYPVLNDRANYLRVLAEEYSINKDLQLSKLMLIRASKFSPSKEIYYALGETYVALSDTGAAKKCYQLVDSAIPGLIKPSYLTALLYYNVGDTTKFITQAHKTIRMKPRKLNQQVINLKKDLRRILDSIAIEH